MRSADNGNDSPWFKNGYTTTVMITLRQLADKHGAKKENIALCAFVRASTCRVTDSSILSRIEFLIFVQFLFL